MFRITEGNTHWDFTPSSFEWSLEDISALDSGRDNASGTMYPNKIARKRKLAIEFQNVDSMAEANRILRAVCPAVSGDIPKDTITVTFPDPLAGTAANDYMITRTFYSGEKSASVYMWTANRKIMSSIKFDIVEV